MKEKKWKVLIVCSSKDSINLDYYANDPSFSAANYSFFNVGTAPFTVEGFGVLNSSQIPGYAHLGRKYAESEVLYNVRKLNLYREYPYLGLMHSDFNFFDRTTMLPNVTDLIDCSLNDGTEFVSFFTGMLSHVVGYYNVLMDERKPNCLFVRDSKLDNPKSVNSMIVADIEKKFGKKLDLNSFPLDSKVALCCSFLANREIFNGAADLIVDLIDSGRLNGFDVEDRHRFPGQVAERYVALYSLLFKKACFMLDHKFVGGREDLMKNSNAENY